MKQNTYSSRSDTLLPQDEGTQYYSDIRGKHLANKRLQYEFELYKDDPNVPVMVNKFISCMYIFYNHYGYFFLQIMN